MDRSTVHRWIRNDYSFQAALNRAKNDAHEAVQSRLRNVAARATEIVEEAVDKGDVKAALAILKAIDALPGRRHDRD